MRFQPFVAAAAISIATFSAQASAVELVTNGSFETGDFTGWTQFGDTSFTGVQSGFFNENPTDGSFQAVFGPINGIGGISQTFASAGTYTVSFDLANIDGSFSSVDFGGVNLLSGVGNSGYISYSFTTTVGANSVLSFSFANQPDYYSLDNVSVTSNVPEAATWAMLIAGFGLVGAAARRRQVALAA